MNHFDDTLYQGLSQHKRQTDFSFFDCQKKQKVR